MEGFIRRKKLLDDEVDVAQTHQANGWKEDYNHTTLHASSILRGNQGYWKQERIRAGLAMFVEAILPLNCPISTNFDFQCRDLIIYVFHYFIQH